MKEQMTPKMANFLRRLAYLMEEFNAGFTYTRSDDGTHVVLERGPDSREDFNIGYLNQGCEQAIAINAALQKYYDDQREADAKNEEPRAFNKEEFYECKFTTCPVCGDSGSTTFMDKHHPCGRKGNNMNRTVKVHRHCHNWIHNNVEMATRLGFLWKLRNTRDITDGEWEALLKLMNSGERIDDH